MSSLEMGSPLSSRIGIAARTNVPADEPERSQYATQSGTAPRTRPPMVHRGAVHSSASMPELPPGRGMSSSSRMLASLQSPGQRPSADERASFGAAVIRGGQGGIGHHAPQLLRQTSHAAIRNAAQRRPVPVSVSASQSGGMLPATVAGRRQSASGGSLRAFAYAEELGPGLERSNKVR